MVKFSTLSLAKNFAGFVVVEYPQTSSSHHHQAAKVLRLHVLTSVSSFFPLWRESCKQKKNAQQPVHHTKVKCARQSVRDSNFACHLFDIILRSWCRGKTSSGKIVDLTLSKSNRRTTNSLDPNWVLLTFFGPSPKRPATCSLARSATIIFFLVYAHRAGAAP